MRIGVILTLGLLLLNLATGSALAQPTPPPGPATVFSSQQFDFTSAVNGKTYRITLAAPLAFPPKGGFRVIYVLDGQSYFDTFADAARFRALNQELEPAVVVGIGYDGGLASAQVRRNYDLTPVGPDAEQRAQDIKTHSKAEYAGAEAFFKVIETEIKPKVAKIFPVATGKEILFGHSLGGLFVLHTLFNHPEAFQTYVALSPSIWWADRDVLKGEAGFAKRVKVGEVGPRIFIGVGGLEQALPKSLPPGMTMEDAKRLTIHARMVDNGKELSARLSALTGTPGYVVQSQVFPGLTHGSVPWTALNPMLNFALGKDRPKP